MRSSILLGFMILIVVLLIGLFTKDLLLKELLLKPLQKEILLPQSFWRETDIKFFWAGPYDDFWSGENVIRTGTVLSDKESGKDIIHLNLYDLVYSKFNYRERVSSFREVLAHETGHILYNMARGDKAYELKEKFHEELGEKFKRQCVEYFGIYRCFSNSWEYRDEEAFADIARIIICPLCRQQPETAVVLTPQLKDLVRQIINIALNQQDKKE